jgi:hypothetical protein
MILLLQTGGWDIVTSAWTASDSGTNENKTSIYFASTRPDPYVRLKIPFARFEHMIRHQVGHVCDLREWCEGIS